MHYIAINDSTQTWIHIFSYYLVHKQRCLDGETVTGNGLSSNQTIAMQRAAGLYTAATQLGKPLYVQYALEAAIAII